MAFSWRIDANAVRNDIVLPAKGFVPAVVSPFFSAPFNDVVVVIVDVVVVDGTAIVAVVEMVEFIDVALRLLNR